MSASNPFKFLLEETTQLAVSTSLLAASQTGCLIHRDEDFADAEPDAGEDAIVEQVARDDAATYHEPPSRASIVVIEANLDDAPRTPPPRRVTRPMTTPAQPIPPAWMARSRPAQPTVVEDDLDEDVAEADEAITAAEADLVLKPAPRKPRKPEPKVHDPVADSYLRSYSTPGVGYR